MDKRTKEDYLKLLQRKRYRKHILALMKKYQNNKTKQHISLPRELIEALKEYHRCPATSNLIETRKPEGSDHHLEGALVRTEQKRRLILPVR